MPKGRTIEEPSRLVQEALEKYKSGSKRGLARYLFEKYPLHFKDEEHARSLIRLYTNTIGSRNREVMKEKTFRLDLPESHAEVFEPFKIKGKKILILSDIHLPYQDNNALDAAISYGIKNKCDTVLINGDMLDCYQISRYEKRPDKPTIGLEFESGKQLIKELRKTFKSLIFKVGNHEERWDRFLMNNPAIFGLEFVQLQNILGLRDVEYVKSKQIMKAGKLTIIHGHELSKGINSPVNFAKTLFNKLGESTLAGHLHQTSEHSFTRHPSGELVTCWSVGCLCDLHPEYSPLPQWNLGWATVEVDRGLFHVNNIRFKGGKQY